MLCLSPPVSLGFLLIAQLTGEREGDSLRCSFTIFSTSVELDKEVFAFEPSSLGSVSPAKHYWVALLGQPSAASARTQPRVASRDQHGICCSSCFFPIRTISASVIFLKSAPCVESVLPFVDWAMLLGLGFQCAWVCNAEEGRAAVSRSL